VPGRLRRSSAVGLTQGRPDNREHLLLPFKTACLDGMVRLTSVVAR